MIKNPSSEFSLVYVEWVDAYANGSWMDKQEFERWADPQAVIIHEVGWLIRSDKHCYVLAARYNSAGGTYGMMQMIPKTWCKITVLAKPNKRKLPREKRYRMDPRKKDAVF